MLGVKLTILGIVLLILMWFILRGIVRSSSRITQFKIATKKTPTWFNAMSYIIAALFILDIVGIIYSVIWLLFLK